MNVLDLKATLDREVQRPDMSFKYLTWINRALKKITQDFSWNCMRHSETVTVLSGESSVKLPDDYKEMTPEESPVHLRHSEATGKIRWVPSKLSTFEELARKDAMLLFPYAPQSVITDKFGIPVYTSVEGDEQVWYLNVFGTADADLPFRVSYFRFLPRLESDTQSNYLTREYEEMVEAKLKATAFMSLNDPVAADFEGLYRDMARLARAANELQRFQGRTLRFGGN
jgi:hypothetical protein